jgi:hypothetical protein
MEGSDPVLIQHLTGDTGDSHEKTQNNQSPDKALNPVSPRSVDMEAGQQTHTRWWFQVSLNDPIFRVQMLATC